jgi:hypothetical protein
MSTSFKILVLSGFVFFFLESCNKDYVISDKQEILFQFDYINYTLGYMHYGYLIDNEGNILTYKNPEEWNFPDKNNNLSQKQLAQNMFKCNKTGEKIDNDELLKYTGYIKNIASSKVTAPKNVAEDAGSSEFICYQFSESSEMYKGYLIKMEGDFTCENLNFYSKKVTSWMKEINNRITRN